MWRVGNPNIVTGTDTVRHEVNRHRAIILLKFGDWQLKAKCLPTVNVGNAPISQALGLTLGECTVLTHTHWFAVPPRYDRFTGSSGDDGCKS